MNDATFVLSGAAFVLGDHVHIFDHHHASFRHCTDHGAFGASVWSTVFHGAEVYFDSVCMFAFFLLSSRYLEMGARHRAGEAAEELGYSHMDIVSGAGHDACWINDVAPTAMIMCPCVDGLSHNEAEEITPDSASASR